MTVIRGLAGLKGELERARAARRHVQLLGATDDFARLTALTVAVSSEAPVVVVLPRSKDLGPWCDFFDSSLRGLQKKALRAAVLPFYSGWGQDRFVSPALIRRQRLYALSLLAGQGPGVVVTTMAGLGQKTISLDAFRTASINLRVTAEIEPDLLAKKLDDLTYAPRTAVDEEGTYSLRGGILDVFPMGAEDPVRIEFMGDEIVSLRSFSVSTQRSKGQLEVVSICPALEAFLPMSQRKEDTQKLFNFLLESSVEQADRDGMVAAFLQGALFAGFDMFLPLFRETGSATAFEYLNRDATLVFPKGLDDCLNGYDEFLGAIDQSYKNDMVQQRPSLTPDAHYQHFKSLKSSVTSLGKVEMGNPFEREGAVSLSYTPSRTLTMPTAKQGELFDAWFEVITKVIKEEGSVVILAHSEDQIERVTNLLAHREQYCLVERAALFDLIEGKLKPGIVYVGVGELADPLWLDDSHTLVISEPRLFGTTRLKRRSASQKLQNYLSSFRDLKIGDLVVHVLHGIARYAGMKTLDVAGLTNDFLVLEYAGGDKVYLPVDRLSLLQRYASGSDSVARVDKLGGQTWDKRKAGVKKAVRDMAEELLKIQAKRATAHGLAYGPPDNTFLKFEAAFPYDETEDQIRSLMDVEGDLRSAKPMDRLICGDVGFGKTEIALRAAFRTVLEGYQVLVLVPTTVLCYQHFRTFQARMSPFGVKVAQINRFVGRLESNEATKSLQDGRLDVLIGTHRLLSKDIKPKRLGMLIIDEEQRFGVAHKEKLKHLRAGADVLTLTATPIPRTLHMSMVGLRDISIITTPPQDRLSVKTYISKFDETLIKDAILQEVRRGGQVFFVHNRVEDIEEMRTFIRSLVPHLEVRIGHGQMREHQLERVIVDFIDQKFPVLVCTTIIESGIDMPNVNTLIVNRADRFGLAQLYQLRGRVGRSNVQAYAYFLTPHEEHLSDDAKKRLDVLAAHQELGAGFQIASHDLELRGAGNLLGGEQSGHAASVGLELYTDMLEQAIHELRGEPVTEKIDTEIKLPLSAAIPTTYIASESQRLQVYKSLFGETDPSGLLAVKNDLIDRFGPLPRKMELVLAMAKLKQQLASMGASRIAASSGNVVEISFHDLESSRVDKILSAVRRQPDKYRLAPGNRLLLFYNVPKQPSIDQQEILVKDLGSMLAPLE